MKKPIGTIAQTDLLCPESGVWKVVSNQSGVWKVVSNPSTTATLAKGDKMPLCDGNAVTWKLTAYV